MQALLLFLLAGNRRTNKPANPDERRVLLELSGKLMVAGGLEPPIRQLVSKVHENPAEILIVFFQTVIQFLDF
jgi:hypothetical protein